MMLIEPYSIRLEQAKLKIFLRMLPDVFGQGFNFTAQFLKFHEVVLKIFCLSAWNRVKEQPQDRALLDLFQ